MFVLRSLSWSLKCSDPATSSHVWVEEKPQNLTIQIDFCSLKTLHCWMKMLFRYEIIDEILQMMNKNIEKLCQMTYSASVWTMFLLQGLGWSSIRPQNPPAKRIVVQRWADIHVHVCTCTYACYSSPISSSIVLDVSTQRSLITIAGIRFRRWLPVIITSMRFFGGGLDLCYEQHGTQVIS